MKSRISDRTGRTMIWVVALIVAGLLFNGQQAQQNRADKDRDSIRALVVQNKASSLQTKKDNDIITRALCTYIDDLKQRQEGSQQLLKDHPNGLPGLATAQSLKTSIDGQQHAIDSLGTIRCTP